MLSVVMLNVVILNVVIPNVVKLNVVMLNVDAECSKRHVYDNCRYAECCGAVFKILFS
jgi:hypothetical protein